jgi:hypothetical protein
MSWQDGRNGRRGGRKMGEGFAIGIIFANFVALKTEPIAFFVTNG